MGSFKYSKSTLEARAVQKSAQKFTVTFIQSTTPVFYKNVVSSTMIS